MAQFAKKIALTSLIIVMFQSLGFTQSPEKIIIDKQYYGTLDQILDRISLEKGILFSYNKRKISQIQVDDNTVNQPLDKLLNNWCLVSKMEWYLNTDGIINIVGLNRTPGTAAAKTEAVKTYSGPPKNFNILISGKIADSETGEAVPYASVVIAGTTRGTQTNQDGYYTLQNVPTDTSTVLVSSIGYKTESIFLTPDLPKTKLDVQIEPSTIEMDEVEVKAQRNTVMSTNDKISSIQITPRKLAELPNIGEKDILRSFQLMPGVSGANEGTSGLFVRGGTPDQNLILYDGFTVYHVDHLYGFFSAFNSNAVKDVQLYKGGFESKYAGRLSSVTDITGKDGNSKGFNIGGDLSLLVPMFMPNCQLATNSLLYLLSGNRTKDLFTTRYSISLTLQTLLLQCPNLVLDERE